MEASFPQASEDFFHDMDNGVQLTPDCTSGDQAGFDSALAPRASAIAASRRRSVRRGQWLILRRDTAARKSQLRHSTAADVQIPA